MRNAVCLEHRDLSQETMMPTKVAARSRARTVFALSKAGVVGLNSSRGMGDCVYL
jgi:hypothetical protein